MVPRKLGIASLKNYELIEIVNASNGDFVLIYTDKNNIQPTIIAQVKYISHNDSRMFAMFKANSVDNSVGLNSEAFNQLEYESINVAEAIRKCLCANTAMIET